MAETGNIKISELTSYYGLNGSELLPVSVPVEDSTYYMTYKTNIEEIRSYMGVGLGIEDVGQTRGIAYNTAYLGRVVSKLESSITDLDYESGTTQLDDVTVTVNNTVPSNKTVGGTVGVLATTKFESTVQQSINMAEDVFTYGNLPANNPITNKFNEVTYINETMNVAIAANDVPGTSTKTWTNSNGDVQNHIVGDRRIVPDPNKEIGYSVYTLIHFDGSNAIWTELSADPSIYDETCTITLTSNHSGDTGLNNQATITVTNTTDSETIYSGTWTGSAVVVKITPKKNYTVSVTDVSGYSCSTKSYSYVAAAMGTRSVSFTYNTTYVYFTPTSNQGAGDTAVQSATGTVNGTAVSYGGYVKVATGSSYTVVANALARYAKPGNATGTASGTSVTPSMQYQTTVVTVTMTSTVDVSAARATVTCGTTVDSNLPSGSTVKVPTGSSFSVSYSTVSPYTSPSTYSGTASGTSMTVTGTYIAGAYLTVTFSSNQGSSDSILNSANATVKNTSTSATIATLTKSSNRVFITYGVPVSITYSSATGYKTPATVTFTMGSTDVSYTATWQTEVCTLTLSGGSGNVTCTINGTSQTISSSNGSMTVKVPFGVSYTVTCGTLEGYYQPNTVSRTAKSATYSVSQKYMIINHNILLEDINHNTYEYDTVLSSAAFNSIVIKTSLTTSFRVFVPSSAKTLPIHKNYTDNILTYTTALTQSAAETDYNGKSRTNSIINFNTAKSTNTTSYAAPYCVQTNWPEGASITNYESYLPAMGQLKIIGDNKDFIDALLTKKGWNGRISTRKYWSSSIAAKSGSYYRAWARTMPSTATATNINTNCYLLPCKSNATSATLSLSGGGNTFSHTGGTTTLTIKCHSNTPGGAIANPWKLQFWNSSTSQWQDTSPLSYVTASQLSGSGDATVTLTCGTRTDGTAITSIAQMLRLRSPVTDVDLSFYNYQQDYVQSETSSRNTANCYIISRAGTYKIPLVYGNAIKNGETNTEAFAPTGTSSNYFLTPFINHNRDGITDPWLKNNNATPDGAQLVWQDVQGLISTVGISGDYLTFTVNQNNIAEGNAVIAATKSGVIVWSWHIWVTTRYLDSQISAKFAPLDATWNNSIHTGSHYYFNEHFLPVGWTVNDTYANMGSSKCYTGLTLPMRLVNTETGAVTSAPYTYIYYREESDLSLNNRWCGAPTYYQWGRKDPIPSTVYATATGDPEMPTTLKTIYDINNNVITFTTFAGTGKYYNECIKNPAHMYIAESNTGNILSNCNYTNLWDGLQTAPEGSPGIVTRATSKTIYDPCPPGYCVPTSGFCRFFYDGDVYTNHNGYFTSNLNWSTDGTAHIIYRTSTWYNTYYFSWACFPLCGYINYYWTGSSARGSEYNYRSYNWSATGVAGSTVGGYAYYYEQTSRTSTTMNYYSTQQFRGFMIIPVKEE